MSFDSYTFEDSYLPVGGADFVPDFVDRAAKNTVGTHYLIASVLILVLVIIVIFLWFRGKESFFANATTTMRFQQRSDGLGEFLAADPVTAQAVAGGTVILPSGAIPVVSPFGYDCSGVGAPSSDAEAEAWTFLNNAARSPENMTGGRPTTDNDFSKILAGRT